MLSQSKFFRSVCAISLMCHLNDQSYVYPYFDLRSLVLSCFELIKKAIQTLANLYRVCLVPFLIRYYNNIVQIS